MGLRDEPAKTFVERGGRRQLTQFGDRRMTCWQMPWRRVGLGTRRPTQDPAPRSSPRYNNKFLFIWEPDVLRLPSRREL